MMVTSLERVVEMRDATNNEPLRLSVVVPTYNRSRLLEYTLRSLAAQSLSRQAFEVIVADDGSSDDTRAVVGRFESPLQLQYRFQVDDGYRVAAARNMGLAAARAPVTLFLDSGVLASPRLLEAHLVRHERAATPRAVIGYVYGFDQDNAHGEQIDALIDVASVDETIARLASEPRHGDIRDASFRRYHDDLASLPAPWCLYWTCNASVATAAARAVGCFDETFRSWGVEDVELAYRLHRFGVVFELTREGAAVHCPHPKDFAANFASSERNCAYFKAKFPSEETALFESESPLVLNDILLGKHPRKPNPRPSEAVDGEGHAEG